MPKPRDPYLRQRVLDMRANNRPVDWIASNLNLPKRTVYDWCRSHRESAHYEFADVLEELHALASETNNAQLADIYARLKSVAEALIV